MLETALAIVFLPFLGAAATPLVARRVGERAAYFAASVALVVLGLVTRLYLSGDRGLAAVEWVPSLGIRLGFYVDGLSLLIAFLASGVGVLILTYSGGYMHGETGLARYYATLLAFMGSMLGMALAADLIALFTFWELTSVSSFVLIGHYSRSKDSQYAARKSMLITVAGGLFMLVGFILLAWTGDTFLLIGDRTALLADPGATVDALRDAGLFGPVLLLVGIGAATKSAQVPFHVWLPNAMEAPTPVSAFLHSATMVKAGVYLVGRFRPLFLPASGAEHGGGAAETGVLVPEWSLVFVTLGLATMTVAAILAVAASDIKELLAYSTASHLGLITAGFGVASKLGAETGAFHILNHASFKAALFLVAGIIAHEAGTRRIDELGGLRHDLPITAAVAAVASLSMAGVPPFNGFYSKELLFEATYELAHGGGGILWAFPVVAVFGSIFTFLYSIRFLSLFWGDRRDELGVVHRPPVAMLVPPALLGGLVVWISVLPGTAIDVLIDDVVVSAVGGGDGAFSVGIPTTLKPPVLMSGVTIAAGILLWPQYGRLQDAIRRGLRGPIRANWWYDGGVEGLTASSRRITPWVQTGLIRTYAAWALGGATVLTLGGYLVAGVTFPPLVIGEGVTAAIVLVLLVTVVGGIATASAPSHIAGVLTLSVLGFMIAIFYILADAPDLALTQLTVETLVLVIFLLVLNRLPAFYGDIDRLTLLKDGALSALVGGMVFLTVVLATSGSPDPTVRETLLERAGIPAEHGPFFTDFGGGTNVVNVVLVDLRAFDTLGEVSVVAMAALAVLTLIRMRERGESQ